MKLVIEDISEKDVLKVLMELVPHSILCNTLIKIQQMGHQNISDEKTIAELLKHLPQVKLS